jgi:hypothetical protein
MDAVGFGAKFNLAGFAAAGAARRESEAGRAIKFHAR